MERESLGEPFDTLLSAAILAPSGDNTQPWRFVVDAKSSSITVLVDEFRDRSPMNAGQRMARIACGAAIENILRTAAHNQWRADVEFHDSSFELATIRLEGDFSQAGHVEDVLRDRHTNRWPYSGKGVTPEALQTLQERVLPSGPTDIRWITDRAAVNELADIIGQADAEMFSRRDFLVAFLENVRFDLPSNAPASEGLPTGSLGLRPLEIRSLPWLRALPSPILRSPLLRRGFRQKASALVRSADGLCIIFRSASDTPADTHVGISLERVWLNIEGEGLAAQPMMSLPVLLSTLSHEEGMETRTRPVIEALQIRIQNIARTDHRTEVAAIIRFGVAPEAPTRTGRRSLAESLKVALFSAPSGLF